MRATNSRPPIIGTLIGLYRIVREPGHGEIGTVYLAERADGEFDQQVAIKVVAGGVSTDVLSRRFREERQPGPS
jgi:eukaryotic-like serine/threonine-protein kinase